MCLVRKEIQQRPTANALEASHMLRTELGILGFRALLANIEGWGREGYWAWLEEQIVEQLLESQDLP